MRIALVSLYPNVKKINETKGPGVSFYAYDLFGKIPFRKEDEVYVLAQKSLETGNTQVNLNIIPVFDKGIKYLFQICSKIRELKPDVIHIQHEMYLFGGLLTAYLFPFLLLLLRPRTITTLHGVINLNIVDKDFVKQNNAHFPPFAVKIGFFILYFLISKFANSIIVHEEYFKDILVNNYKANPSKITVIPLGMSTGNPVPRKEARSRLNIPENINVVIFLGYLTGYKGIPLLVDGFKAYIDKYDSEALLLLCSGRHVKLAGTPDYEKYYSETEQNALSTIGKKNIRWEGFIAEKDFPLYFGASDIAIYPYTNQLASSGPMSISVGHGLPFLASEAFSNVFDSTVLFDKTPTSLADELNDYFSGAFRSNIDAYKDNMLNTRSWESVGQKTFNLYISS